MSQRIFLVAGLLLSLSMMAYGQPAFTDSIVVRGEAVSAVAPDAVVWTVALERTSSSRDRARSAVDAETRRVREVAAAAGLLESDMGLARLHVWREDQGYVARRTITLSQKKLSDAIAMMNDLNALRPSDLSYALKHSRRKEVEHETQRQAVTNARLQARTVAQELGTTLGNVIIVENEFGEGGAFGVRPRFTTYKTVPLEFVSAETFTGAKIRVHASVYVTYSIGSAVAAAG